MIRCLIRKEAVAATPEEFVRQRVLTVMSQLGYPCGLIAVEQCLHQLPHLKSSTTPLRRADILCYGKGVTGDLYPLLLVECKAMRLTQATIRQVCGYNHYVRARFIAVANQEEIRVGWLEKKAYRFVPDLPRYKELIG